MISGLQTLDPTTYSQVANNGSKIYVPVRPEQVIYTQFDHISGYAPINSSESGIPVSKIKILNTLIDQLVSMQTKKVKPELPTELTDQQIDNMIKDYQKQIDVAMETAKNNPFSFDGLSGFSKGSLISTAF
ncbi:MAG: hypothetical protein K5839_03900 [Treponemataceae bacterium]|nr:hypothetical protein [Treponemataceae bacterium]